MDEVITAIDLAHATDVRIIDIRKKPDDRRIPNSERFDGEALAAMPPFPKDEPVVIYCGSGNSCSRIAAALRERGYATRALEGGYAAWQEAGLETEPIGERQPL